MEDEERSQPGSRPRRPGRPDYSGPAFTPREVRDKAVDALPYSSKQRRAVWWQIIVMALVVDVAVIWLVVRAVVEDDRALVGLAIYAAVLGIPLTWGAWRLRRLRRPASFPQDPPSEGS